jgi:transcription elongation factor Elf1
MTEPMSCPDCNSSVSVKVTGNEVLFTCKNCSVQWSTYAVGYAIHREGERV